MSESVFLPIEDINTFQLVESSEGRKAVMVIIEVPQSQSWEHIGKEALSAALRLISTPKARDYKPIE